jgi:hypothetical protein
VTASILKFLRALFHVEPLGYQIIRRSFTAQEIQEIRGLIGLKKGRES